MPNGIFINGNATTVLAIDTTASDNDFGIHVLAGVLRLAHSTISGNKIGVSQGGGPGASAGNNFIHGNDTDVLGSLPNVGTG